MRKRIDRYLHKALQDFAKWYVESDWLGKERDCVNGFAHDFIYKEHAEESAIRDPLKRTIRSRRNLTDRYCQKVNFLQKNPETPKFNTLRRLESRILLIFSA